MRVRHVVKNAPKLPQPGKVYGARLVGMRLGMGSVTAEWHVYAHKTRKKGGKKHD